MIWQPAHLSLALFTAGILASSVSPCLAETPAINYAIQGQSSSYNAMPTLNHYQHVSSAGVDISTQAQLFQWVQIEVDLQAQAPKQFSEIQLDSYYLETERYSALANVGKAFSLAGHQFTPFAQFGVNYDNTQLLTSAAEPQDVNRLQYGLGISYRNQNWKNMGISFSYHTLSTIDTQNLHYDAIPLNDVDRSVGLKIDFNF